MRARFWGVAAIVLLGAAVYWAGCGGSDHGSTTEFSGEVASVAPAAVASQPSRERALAFHLPEIVAPAFAQSSCAGANLIFCVKSFTSEACEPVRASDCTFTVETALSQDRIPLTLRFVKDTNGNDSPDSGESASTVEQTLVYCNGDKVSIANAAVDFLTGTTTATVVKTEDRCAVATATPAATGTPGTPTGTITPSGTTTPTGTTTPSYVASASLNDPPSSALAFLVSAGVMGMLLPGRRRRDGGSSK